MFYQENEIVGNGVGKKAGKKTTEHFRLCRDKLGSNKTKCNPYII